MRRTLVGLVALALGGALVFSVACGGGGNEDKAAVEAAINRAIAAYNGNDVEGFLAAVTDAFMQTEFDSTKEELRAAAESPDFVLAEDPITVEVESVDVSGDTAGAEVTLSDLKGLEVLTWTMIHEGDAWLLDDSAGRATAAPEGSTEVDLSLVEFAFNLAQLNYPAGDVTFHASNDGQQPHEMGILKLPEGLSIEQALEAEDPTAVAEVVAHFGPVEPGEKGTWTLQGLEPGRYGYACFVSDANDPEGTPHAFKGMVGEFTVQ